MIGMLPLVKPPGMTSHDLVAFLRRHLRTKVGHVGTLDPAAAGLLLTLLGKATRLSQYLVGCDKVYVAEITFGLSTATADVEGEITDSADANFLTEDQLTSALAPLQGPLELPVPRYSAVKVDGRRLYREARRGRETAPPVRTMQVHSWELLGFQPGLRARARTRLHCGSGTYVRSLATALGESLGIPAHLSFLVRTQVGATSLDDALTCEETLHALDDETLAETLLTPSAAVAHLPSFQVPPAEVSRVAHGHALPWTGATPPVSHSDYRLLDSSGALLALARVQEEPAGYSLHPATVLVTGS